MFKLLKQLFTTNEDKLTVVILKEHGLAPSSKYSYRPVTLWALSIGAALIIVALVLILFIFTPLGGFAYNQKEMRKSVIAIQQKVEMLQDTIAARNKQLTQMRNVMAFGKDLPAPEAEESPEEPPVTSVPEASEPPVTMQEKEAAKHVAPAPQVEERHTEPKQFVVMFAGQDSVTRIPDDMLLISNLLRQPPEFPATYPLDGTLTRGFNSQNGHLGIDIAAEKGSAFTAIADGVIINQEWTINYGYVIIVQHGHHLVSIYKHATSLKHKIGDMVRQGDILGTIGDIGIISSGPHLHLEIWSKGVPQNPQRYFVNT